MVARVPSKLSPSQLKQQLHLLGLSQRRFAVRSALRSRTVEQYCANGSTVPGYIARLVQYEQLLHDLTVLTSTSGKRVSKRMMQVILRAADEPVTATPAPKRAKAAYKPRRRNYLTKKYLPRPPVTDELEAPATWQQLASRIGEDAAKRLHERLAQRRPAQPRGIADVDEVLRVRTKII